MDVILIHGLWLDGSSWDDVVPILERAGHRTHALTLPGMESRDADRSAVTLRDHISAVIDVVDDLDPANGKVTLVAHSRGGAVAHAVADARADRIARVVYVASEPVGDGRPGPDHFPVVDGEVPLPEWSFFDKEELGGLDEKAREAIRKRAVPSPVGVVRDTQRLQDERRYDVPVTVITCEYSSVMLRELMAQGHPDAQELAKIRDIEFVDLFTGHWPQFSKPVELGRAILKSLGPT